MSAMNPYRTLRQFASDEFIINKSRFIGYAAPCETEAEALAFLQSIRTKHKDATHNCYAYIIGQNAGIMRYSDDGEPGGHGRAADDGGIEASGRSQLLLRGHALFRRRAAGRGRAGARVHAGGSRRAQGGASRRDASLLPIPVRSRLSAVGQGAVRAERLPVQLLSSEFTTAVGFTLLIRQTDAQSVLDTLTRVTDGRIETLLEEESYRAWDSESK